MAEKLVKSRQRVADHGEVFTPRWLVDDMLDLVKREAERIDSRFLEPACGSGNFLVPVLERKLAAVEARYGRSDFEKRHYALFALMCVYGIELLPDNAAECRENLQGTFARVLKLDADDALLLAARALLEANIVQGDALAMTDAKGEPIVFPEWGYLGRGKYQRRDFRFDALTQRSAASGTLFDAFEEHEIFTPVRTYAAMSVDQIAHLSVVERAKRDETP
ncbi:SAM-dependent methyltransferase [Microbacterium sp. KUDC0406]|uniref:N-6 DNA methylase n=1 Tax=Microbacterium sp. KUDC0406 TaxID=2909588 RepID=UPI001F40BFFA|nr:N-6 DNA methylase [Microbacterium sp. KUDC0406]UJP10112.1 SAM-dependent methyltransferase [Microbacterium sp. KUDC0406]